MVCWNDMGELRHITADDHAAAAEIVDLTYRLLEGMDLPELNEPGMKTPEVIGASGVCVEVSDAVTRAAHSLGVMASRECHDGHYHYITSFGPLDRPPAETDPILCLTWGQFNLDAFLREPEAYFGERRGIRERLRDHYYEDAYGAGTTLLRQTAHTPGLLPNAGHVWLETTPEEVANGGCPIGEVPRGDYPADMWEPEPLPQPVFQLTA